MQSILAQWKKAGVETNLKLKEGNAFIASVLGHCDGSLTKAADALGMHRNTLTRKMGEYKIKRRAG